MTSSVTHNVRLPRRRRPASYANQFFTRNFIFGMWWRRAALCLFGMDRIASPLTVLASLLDSDGVHATTPPEWDGLARYRKTDRSGSSVRQKKPNPVAGRSNFRFSDKIGCRTLLIQSHIYVASIGHSPEYYPFAATFYLINAKFHFTF